MIVVTGGAGFIGSAIVWKLNRQGREDIIIVDELGTGEKWKNLNGLLFADFYHKDEFYDLITEDRVLFEIESIIHMGACSSTTETDADYLFHNNYRYSMDLAKYSLSRDIRFIYASSAATYGDGRLGYNDNIEELIKLRPLNMYGYSKHMFDLWVKRMNLFDKFVGLKYFNVYGPNEFHKGEMRSVIHKAFEQIKYSGKVRLFKSYKDDYKDGEQQRDFIYVKDAVDMTLYFLDRRDINGLFNIGSGRANTWNDLVKAIFDAMNKPLSIEYIDMPDILRGKYQYFTEANLIKLRNAGYSGNIFTIEDGVKDYVKNYLLNEIYLGMGQI